jgi:prophage antirepressor-like protein
MNLSVFQGHQVRFFPTQDGSFEVVAVDVAKVLEYSDTSEFSALVDIEYKYLREIHGVKTYRATVLTEPGLYQALAKSGKPMAKGFQKWLFEEVLPEIRKTGSYGNTVIQNEPPKLPPYVEAENIAKVIRNITDTLFDNPRLAQALVDHAMSTIMANKALPGTSEPKLRGVVEIAEEMGFSQAVEASTRTRLGKFIAKLLPHLAVKETRLCNGTQRQINCYPDIPEVRDAITKYFS